MHSTQHFDQRMNQRGIDAAIVNAALDYGNPEGDRFVLGRREIDAELTRLEREKKVLLRARDKGGVSVVTQGDTLITTFRVEKRRKH